MLLTPPGVVRYLLRRRYLPAGCIVRHPLRVSESTARNRGFRVTFGSAQGYWVKQIREWSDAGVASFHREARWYWLVRNDPRFAQFQSIVPACLAYDEESEILVMELVPGAHSLQPHQPWLSPACAARLGQIVAQYQRGGQLAATAAGFPSTAPWIFTLADLPRDPEWAGAAREIVNILGKYPGFGPTLKAMHDAWTTTTLVHGDMKFENCIRGEDQIKIIDWEMACAGDPLWDAAGILQAYWEAWIRGMEPREELSIAARAFWQSYADEVAPGDRADCLVRTVRYAAARLIQTAWEDRRHYEKLDAPTLKMLQLSLNVFADPAAAARSLVGL